MLSLRDVAKLDLWDWLLVEDLVIQDGRQLALEEPLCLSLALLELARYVDRSGRSGCSNRLIRFSI